MTTPEYSRTVAAATAETASKFRLAEALALDIPPRLSGQGVTNAGGSSIEEHLADAREAIIEAGGEPRTVSTLVHYRATAMWVATADLSIFRWEAGASFSAHEEARQVGLTFEQFAAMPVRTVEAVRALKGIRGTHGTNVIRNWTPEQKTEAARELLADNHVIAAVEDEARIALAEQARQRLGIPAEPRKRSSQTTFWAAVTYLQNMQRSANEFVHALQAGDISFTDDELDVARRSISRVRAALDLAEALTESGGVTDEALAAFIAGGR